MPDLVDLWGRLWFGWLCLIGAFCFALLGLSRLLRQWRVGLWFRNLPFCYGWRIRRWCLAWFGLQMCPRCGQVVDLAHHSQYRCSGYLHERIVNVEGATEDHNARLGALCEVDRHICDKIGNINNDLGNLNVAINDQKRQQTGDLRTIADRFKRTDDAIARIDQTVKTTVKRLGNAHQRFNGLDARIDEVDARLTDVDEGGVGRSEFVEMCKAFSDKFRGITSCNDILLTRTRRNEDLVNQLNSRLTKDEKELKEFCARVVGLDEALEGEEALRKDLDGLTAQVQTWVQDFAFGLDNVCGSINRVQNEATSKVDDLQLLLDCHSAELIDQKRQSKERTYQVNDAFSVVDHTFDILRKRVDQLEKMEALTADIKRQVEVLNTAENQLRNWAAMDLADIRNLKVAVAELKGETS